MNYDNIPEFEKAENKQPRIEQTLIRMAVDSLSAKQKEVWFLWNNERLTQDELAKVFGITQPAVQQQLQRIEHKIKRWCKLNKGAYLLLKMDHKIMNEGE